jgi:hypothetical protein
LYNKNFYSHCGEKIKKKYKNNLDEDMAPEYMSIYLEAIKRPGAQKGG